MARTLKTTNKAISFSLHNRQVKCSLQGTMFWTLICELYSVGYRIIECEQTMLFTWSSLMFRTSICDLYFSGYRIIKCEQTTLFTWSYLYLSGMHDSCVLWDNALFLIGGYIWCVWHGVKYKTWEYHTLPSFEQRKYE